MFKELYEPLWDELYQRSKKGGFAIRSIWIADCAHQGMSYVLNEDKLGNDRRHIHRLNYSIKLIVASNSVLEGPHSRSLIHGQPFPEGNASAIDRYRT